MIIKQVLEQLETASQPVAKALHKGDHFKVIIIGFKAGMTLKEHKTSLPARLTVLSGSVVYREDDRNIQLNAYDEQEIPVEIFHSVEALSDSLCLLTQG